MAKVERPHRIMSQKDTEKLKNKVAIGIPTATGLIDYRVASSLIALKIFEGTKIIWLPRVMIDTSRNEIVNKTLEDPSYEYLLFLDDDMIFPPDMLEKLLARDEDIVGVQAFKRREMFDPCVYKFKDNKYHPALINKFCEVDAIGTGILLIKTKVFQKIKFPWFETIYDEKGLHWSVDFMFCKKAKKAGFNIYCDPDIEIFHIGDSPLIGKSHFLEYIKKTNLGKLEIKSSSESLKDSKNKKYGTIN